MEKYIEALKRISYADWKKLRMAMDRAFAHQKGESEKQLKLADTDIVKRIIQAQFSCGL